MKKEYLLAITAFFMLSFTTVAITYAGEEATPAISIIKTYKEDINGDGKKEKIVLKETPNQQGGKYYKKIWSEIVFQNKSIVKIKYSPGLEPKIEFTDLNHDGIKDMLASSSTGGSGGIYNYHLNTIKDQKAVAIPLPPQLNLQGQFENNFKATINVTETKERFHLNVINRKKEYIQTGLYQENGKLNEPTELMIDPVAMYKITKVRGKKGYGLRSYRQVSGAYHADSLGVLTATWYFENGKWNLIKTKWAKR
ncbi:hypothetical protein [Heyndrickxia shackletonii]|nr:hypothetical protein [Heyndrickxia shackletonii]NEY97737.1 hypothetical protein [Heyndrickxia shackletonii]